MNHQSLYNLANALGLLAMITVVGYHFIAVNAKTLSAGQQSTSKSS
jgi:hypothetical protein